MNHIMACVQQNSPELLEKPQKKQKNKTETVAPVEEKKNKPIDDIEEDWEPDDEEIEEFAVWLGMDKDKDKHLFHIARDCMKTPCPPPWKRWQTPDGVIFYYNESTRESNWNHPNDEIYKQKFREAKAYADEVCGPRKF